MAELIAKHTVQRALAGKFVSHAPGTRFEMLDEQAADLVRAGAAEYANPQDVLPVAYVAPQTAPAPAPAAVAAPVQAVAVPATVTDAVAPTEPAQDAALVGQSTDAIRVKRARTGAAE